MDQTIRAENRVSKRIEKFPFKRSDLATRFESDQGPRGHVPWFEFQFPKAVETSLGYPAEIESRASVSSDSLGVSDDPCEFLEVIPFGHPDIVGETSTQQCLVNSLDFRDAKRLIVLERTSARNRRVKITCKRVIDNPDGRVSVNLEGDGDTEA